MYELVTSDEIITVPFPPAPPPPPPQYPAPPPPEPQYILEPLISALIVKVPCPPAPPTAFFVSPLPPPTLIILSLTVIPSPLPEHNIEQFPAAPSEPIFKRVSVNANVAPLEISREST